MAKHNENGPASEGFLSERPGESESRSYAPWIVAGLVVAVVVGILIAFGGHKTSGDVANASVPDAYAPLLTISDLALSQSSNIAGSQITYVDGTITNKGSRVVTGVTVQTGFHLGSGSPAQMETTTLNLIRTRDPYVDIEPVSADPIKPGESKPFRLIFDHVSPDWDQQSPHVRVMHVQLK